MEHYIFNAKEGEASQALRLLRQGWWTVDAHEPHRDALAPGDLALIYLAAPERLFIGRVELGSVVQDSPGGVSLAQIEEWNPPMSMHTVLARIDQSAGARADFDTGVVRITRTEYEAALQVAAASVAAPERQSEQVGER